MTDVFVSYASSNESIVREKLEPLRARSVQFWFAPDLNTIPGGADYAEKIETAIARSKVLLLMATEHAFRSRHVLREVELAVSRNIPVIPLLLSTDLAIPAGFGYRLALAQRICAADPDSVWIDGLVGALRHYRVEVQETADEPARSRATPKKKVSSGLLPYLADRDTQESLIQSALETHVGAIPQRPIAFIVHGEESQCCDMFVQRLATCTIPAYLEQLLGSNQLEWKSVRWPERSADEPDLPSRMQLYRRAVLTKLEQPLNSDAAKLMRHIGALRRPVVFSSILGPEIWASDEPAFIEGVIRWWAALPDIPAPSQPLVMLLSVSYPLPQQSVFDRLFRARSAPSIPAALSKIPHPGASAISFHVLPELSSLSLGDIEDWVREIMQPNEVDEILRVVRALFNRPRKEAEEGVRRVLNVGADHPALETLKEVWESRSASGRLPMDPLARLLKTLLRAEHVLRSI